FRHVRSEFFDYLSRFQFTGDVWALPEGTIFFPGEPLLRVTAPVAEAQLVETSLLSIVHFQTLIASKAARVTTAAAGRPVVEFGSRRAHGVEAGVLAARAAFVGWCQGTSNTFAGRRFGIPVYGTQAHSWIMAHEDEAEAFREFLDAFGVGTALSTSSDSPNVGVIYKLVEVGLGDTVRSAAKFSQEKITYPGRKQVFRFAGKDGKVSGDVIGLDTESFPGGEPLLVPVMRDGKQIEATDEEAPLARIQRVRNRCLADRARMTERILVLRVAEPPFPVRYSKQLEQLHDQVRQTVAKTARIG